MLQRRISQVLSLNEQQRLPRGSSLKGAPPTSCTERSPGGGAMARSAARRIIDEQRKTPRATTQHMTHDRDCTNVQGLLSKRSTPCQLYRRCTDKVAWRGGSRKQQQSKRKRNSPGVPHQKEYPCQLYRAKAKVTGTGLFYAAGWSCICDIKTPRERHQIGATEPRKFNAYLRIDIISSHPVVAGSRGRLAH